MPLSLLSLPAAASLSAEPSLLRFASQSAPQQLSPGLSSLCDSPPSRGRLPADLRTAAGSSHLFLPCASSCFNVTNKYESDVMGIATTNRTQENSQAPRR